MIENENGFVVGRIHCLFFCYEVNFINFSDDGAVYFYSKPVETLIKINKTQAHLEMTLKYLLVWIDVNVF